MPEHQPHPRQRTGFSQATHIAILSCLLCIYKMATGVKQIIIYIHSCFFIHSSMQWLITGTDRVILVANLGGLKAFICLDMVLVSQTG